LSGAVGRGGKGRGRLTHRLCVLRAPRTAATPMLSSPSTRPLACKYPLPSPRPPSTQTPLRNLPLLTTPPHPTLPPSPPLCRDFLTGFRRRKQERRKKAQDDLRNKERRLLLEARAKKREELVRLAEEQEAAIGFSVMDIPLGREGARKKASGGGGGGGGGGKEAGAGDVKRVVVKEDAFTKGAFGSGTVVIESVEGLDALDEDGVLLSNADAVSRTERRVRAKAARKDKRK
jgi:Nucleolar protein 12 (25kDa)